MSKLISIIIPVYTVGKYIERCLESVKNQTYKNFEVVIIDDCSTDNSGEIVENWLKEQADSRFSFYKNEKNIGQARTRNYGIKISKGDYLCFLDSDDWLDEDFLETLYRHIEKDKLDVVVSGYRRPNKNGNIVEILNAKENSEFYKIRFAIACAKLHRSSFVKKYDIDFYTENRYAEDISFSAKEYVHTKKIECIDYIGYNYYLNEKSVTNTAHKGENNQATPNPLILLKYLEKVQQEETNVSYDKELYYYYYYYRLFYTFVFMYTKGWQRSEFLKFIIEFNDIMKSSSSRYYKNKYFPFGPKDEALIGKIMMFVMLTLNKLRLWKIFSLVWCKK